MGGAETWLLEVLRRWSSEQLGEMDFLATGGRTAIFDDEARRLGARIFYLEYGRSRLRRFMREFRKIMMERRYHAIHDHQDYASGWHFLLGGRTLPPIRVTHVHNPAYQIRNNYGVTARRRITAQVGKALVASYSTHIAATSRQSLAEFGFDGPRFRSIPKAALYCGFDPGRFAGDAYACKASLCGEFNWPLNATIVLFAGRIDQSPEIGHSQNHKNSGFAVSVGIEFLRSNPHARMLFAGALSPAVPTLERRIAEAGLRGRVNFLGIRRDIERLMAGSDVLLFPSRGEGLGMVAVEAQAAGLPVLASTEVPRECVVVPGLVEFQSLGAGVARWAADLGEMAVRTRNVSAANDLVAASPFAIDNSVRSLCRLYTEGLLS
jgi:glycosyltransferase involved in cell wall biosynthesis